MATEEFNFTLDFQDRILACAMAYPDKFDVMSDLIRPEFFEGPNPSETVYKMQEYFKVYGKFPDISMLGNFAYTRLERANPEKAKQVLDYITSLTEVDVSDPDPVFDMVVLFARERALLRAAKLVHTSQLQGKDIKGGIIELFEKALEIGKGHEDIGIQFQKDYGAVIEAYGSGASGVATGYQPFSELWRNGWGAGWLVVPLAPPKRYKTTFCLNLALNMAHDSIGADVIYYACEINQDLATARALCSLSGQTLDDLLDSKHKFKLTVDEVMAQYSGRIVIKSYPSRSVTVSDLRLHTKRLIRELSLKPRAVFIDYADTVAPEKSMANAPEYKQQSSIYTDARRLATDFGCTVIMPDRCNRETVEKAVPSMKSFQGAFEKAGIVDIGIGLCQTEEELQSGDMRYFVFLNRHGPEGVLYRGKIDIERYQMTVDESIPYNAIEAEKQDAEKAKAREGHKSRSRKKYISNPDDDRG